MATHKVSELEGALLDAAVAKAEGYAIASIGSLAVVKKAPGFPSEPWSPSDLWQDGGPIIEREGISLWLLTKMTTRPAEWSAATPEQFEEPVSGPTPLIAAMRAYVASKLGEEVELP